MTLAPFFRTPFTDVTGGLLTHQNGSACAKLEIRVLECLEAYGITRGQDHPKCKDLIADFKECEGKWKQTARLEAMRIERHRQYLMGERKEHYAPGPRPDTY